MNWRHLAAWVAADLVLLLVVPRTMVVERCAQAAGSFAIVDSRMGSVVLAVARTMVVERYALPAESFAIVDSRTESVVFVCLALFLSTNVRWKVVVDDARGKNSETAEYAPDCSTDHSRYFRLIVAGRLPFHSLDL